MARTNNPVDSLKRLSVLASFLFCLEILGEVPDDDACSDGNVEGVLGAELGNFQAAVRSINDFLMDALDFVAENDSVFLIRSGRERLEHRGTMSLFDGEDFIALRLQGQGVQEEHEVGKCLSPFQAVLQRQVPLRRDQRRFLQQVQGVPDDRPPTQAHGVHLTHQQHRRLLVNLPCRASYRLSRAQDYGESQWLPRAHRHHSHGEGAPVTSGTCQSCQHPLFI